MKILWTAKFSSKCPHCGERIEEGAQIYYDPNKPPRRKAWHVGCDPKSESKPAAPSQPAPHTYSFGVKPRFKEYDHTYHYDGSAEFAAERPVTERNEGFANNIKSGGFISGSTKNWYGFASTEAGVKAFREGWAEGAERLQESLEDVRCNFEIKSRRRKRHWSDFGDTVDMQRVYRGQIDRAFQKTRRENRSSPGVVTIVINTTTPWNKSSDVLFWTGAAGLKLAEQLEDAGHSTEILVVAAADGVFTAPKHESAAHIITVKQAGAPFDLAALAGVCCSGMTLRFFSMLNEASQDMTVAWSGGTPNRAIPDELKDRERIVCCAATEISDADTAAEWAMAAAEHVEKSVAELAQAA